MAKTLSVKVNASDLLERQLHQRAEKGEYGYIALASATETWMPIEGKLGLTRKCLEIILRYRFPVSIGTKSKLILRDLDLLKKIDQRAILPADLKKKPGRGVIIAFSFSTLDPKLAKILEPGSPPPKERLETLKKVKTQGFLVGANLMPILPFLSDSESDLEKMIKAVKEASADFVFAGGLTLFGKGPADCKTLYYRFLQKYYPDLVAKYKSLYRIFFFPSKEYQSNLEKISRSLCQKYQIKYQLV